VFYGWYIVTAGFIFAMSFGFFNSYGIFFLPIQGEFALSGTATSLVYSLAFGSFTAGNIVAGLIADRSGPRITGLLGTALVAVGFTLSSTANSILELYLYYGVIAGFGWAFLTISGTPSVMRWFIKKRGTAVSYSTAGSAIGVLLFPILFQALVSLFSWRGAFLASGGLALALMLPASIVIRKYPEQMGLKPYGYEEANNNQAKPEKSIPAKMALKTPIFWILYAAYFLGAFTVTAYVVHVVPYAVGSGTAATLAAVAVSFVGLGSLMGRLGGGRLSDIIGRMNSIWISYFSVSLGITILLLGHGVGYLYLASAFVGLGYGGLITSNAAAAGDIFGRGSISAVWGMLSTAFGMGGTVGPIVVAHLLDTFGGYATPFWLIAALGLVATGLIFTQRRVM
jgi:MFS family permease